MSIDMGSFGTYTGPTFTAPVDFNAIGTNGPDVISGYGNGVTADGAWAPAPGPAPAPQQQTAADPNAGLIAYLKAQADASAAREAAALQQAREAASAFLTNTLRTFGLDSLGGQVDALIQQWGTNSDVIGLKLKETTEYKTRFAGLLNLQTKGITDVQNEAQYLQLESSYRQVFRDAGLTSFLGAPGSTDEQKAIGDIVGKYSLSVNEVKDRVADSQRVWANTPQEVKDAFATYYGVDATQGVAYSLDPMRTSEIINRQANAAIAGGLAAVHQLKIGLGVADQIANIAGTTDINQGQLASDMVNASLLRDNAVKLASIESSTLSDDTAVQASLNLDAAARKKVDTLQSRERARFGGSSAFGKGSLSRNNGA